MTATWRALPVPDEWRVGEVGFRTAEVVGLRPNRIIVQGPDARAVAEFCAAAHADIPALEAKVADLEKQLEASRDRVRLLQARE